LAGVADEIVTHGQIGRLGPRALMAFDRDGDDRLSGFLLFRDHLERLHVRVLRVGDGVEIHRRDIAFARAGVGLGPERRQRQVFRSCRLVLDHKRAA
jgi:hypothetical protein